MAITWNNIAAPNFGAANELFKQAQDNLLNVGATLTATAKGYQDAIRKRNTGLIQEYINSARTPEELQSEAFQVGYQNLVNTLAKEYDPVVMNQYKDSRGDVLTKRASDTLNYTQAKAKIEQDDNFNKALIAQATGNLYGDALTQAMANIGAANAYNLVKLRSEQDQQTKQNEIAIRANKLKEEELQAQKDDRNQKRLDEKPITDLNSYVATQQLNEFKQDNPQITSPTYRATVNTFGKNADANKNSELGQKVYAAADRHGVDKELMFTIASIESNWDHGVKSPKGAVGLMGLMPEYNKERGVKDATNIDDNTDGGAVYLKQLGSIFGNDTRKIVAAYNAGQGGVQKAVSQAEQRGGRWEDYLPDETKQYLQRYTDLSSYLKTSNTGRDLNYPSGLKTDTYSGGGSSSSSSSGGSNSTKPDYVNTMLSDLAAVDKTIATEQLKIDLNPDASKGLEAWRKNNIHWYTSDYDPENLITALKARPEIKNLNDAQQEDILETAFNKIRSPNWLGRNWVNTDSNQQQAVNAINEAADEYTQRLNARINAEKKPIYLTGIRAHSAKTGQPMYESARDLLQGDELTIYRLGIESPVVNKAKLLFAQDNKGLSEDAYVSSYLEQYSKNPRETNRDNESSYQKMLDAGLKVEPSNSVTTGASIITQKAEDNNSLDPILKAVKNTPYENVPMAIVLNASKPVPSPLLPEKHQTAPQTKANNLAVDLQSGKVEQTKAPVPMPNVTWAKPVVVERANPISNKLPQYKAVVTYVQDGDTVQLQSNDYSTSGEQNKIICRIDSINAPETAKPFKNMPAQAFSEESKRYLENLIKEGKVNIRIVRPTTRQPNEEKTSSNNYGRDVCQIEVSGADVTVEMIRAGAAMLYRRYNNDAGLSKLEDEAKANKRGLWGLPNPIDPETYNHSYNTQQNYSKPIIDKVLNPMKELSTTEQMLKIQEQMRTTKDPILLANLKQQMLLLLQQKPKEEDKGLFSLYQ